VRQLGVTIHDVTAAHLERSEALFSVHGLLTNDSITLAVMDSLGITDLATNDDDFNAVQWLTVWKPRPA
jgi:predicted nucleic acid-binding protein